MAVLDRNHGEEFPFIDQFSTVPYVVFRGSSLTRRYAHHDVSYAYLTGLHSGCGSHT